MAGVKNQSDAEDFFDVLLSDKNLSAIAKKVYYNGEEKKSGISHFTVSCPHKCKGCGKNECGGFIVIDVRVAAARLRTLAPYDEETFFCCDQEVMHKIRFEVDWTRKVMKPIPLTMA